jgi:peptide deformylase
MAAREILRMGEPSLMESSASLTNEAFNSPELHELIAVMKETMIAANGAGLAAPQIGENVRVVMFEVDNNPRYPDRENIPFTVLINPMITPLTEATEAGWEGCLSVPGMRGLVSRPSMVHYTGFDEMGNAIDRTVNGFHARVVQHECDHLDGILYPMRMTDMSQFGFTDILFPELVGVDDD